MFDAFEQLNNIDENNLLEEGYRSDKRVRETCVSALNLICGTTFTHTDFIIHHNDGNHNNCNISNIRIIQKYQSKNKQLGQFVNGNSAIHRNNYSEHTQNNANGSGIQAIDVAHSIQAGSIIYTYYY